MTYRNPEDVAVLPLVFDNIILIQVFEKTRNHNYLQAYPNFNLKATKVLIAKKYSVLF